MATTSTTISDATQDTAATTIAAITYDVGRAHVEVTLPSGATTVGVLNIAKKSDGVYVIEVADASCGQPYPGSKSMTLQQSGSALGTVPLAMEFSMSAANLQGKLKTANRSKVDFSVDGDITVDVDDLLHAPAA